MDEHTEQRPPRLRGSQGRITILVCGLLVVLVAVIGVSASAAYVTAEQRKLLGICDAAAAAAADRVVSPGATVGIGTGPEASGSEPSLELDGTRVRSAVTDYLRQVGTVEGLEDVRIDDVTVEADGNTARVRLRARIGIPWAAALIGTRPDVVATSWVRTDLSR